VGKRDLFASPTDAQARRQLTDDGSNGAFWAHFAQRVDAWDDEGANVIEHLAGVEDFELAMETYRAACQRWPAAAITLRQGARVIEDSGRTRLV
jgi:hypothetical protein